MKKMSMLILVSVGCLMLIIGCAGTDKIEIRKKLAAMSAGELVDHYKLIESRMIHIDREKEQSINREQSKCTGDDCGKNFNYLGNLHIGDSWNKLKKEKKLTQIEMKNRGIWPPP